MSSNPRKYVIKVFALVDDCMFYSGNMAICVRCPPQGRYEISNNPADVGPGRNVILGNWFTGGDLAADWPDWQITD
jgi:hypothetical protein